METAGPGQQPPDLKLLNKPQQSVPSLQGQENGVIRDKHMGKNVFCLMKCQNCNCGGGGRSVPARSSLCDIILYKNCTCQVKKEGFGHDDKVYVHRVLGDKMIMSQQSRT